MCNYACNSVYIVVEPDGWGEGAGGKLQNNCQDYDYSHPVLCHVIYTLFPSISKSFIGQTALLANDNWFLTPNIICLKAHKEEIIMG